MRGLIAFCLGLVVVLGSGAAWGAEFEDVGEPEEFSQEEIRGPQTGCEASTQTRTAAGVAPDVCTVDYDIRSEVSGNDPSCDLFAKARAGASITARLVSTDEGPGEEVTVCARFRGTLRAEALGNGIGTASTATATAIINRSGEKHLVVGIPPRSVTVRGGEEVEDEFECRRELTTRIGDEIHLALEGESRAEVEGIGDAKGNWDSVILEVRIGDCENLEAFPECPVHSTQPAPSLSHFGLGLLVLLLFGFGTFAVRRRHLQH